MANFVLSAAGVFPDGTSVGAYPASRWGPDVPSGAPKGSAVESQSISGSQATYTTLNSGETYHFAAQVNSVWRYLTGTVGEDAGPLTELRAAADAAVATHSADTTAVHGIADTANFPLAQLEQIATDRLLGRDTAGTGDVEQISLSTGLEFSGAGAIRVPAGGLADDRLASPNNSAYRHAIAWQAVTLPDTETAGTFVISPSFYAAAKVLTHPSSLGAVYLDPADFAVAGLTTKYRVRATVLVNTVTPVTNIQVGLYPVTATGGSADIGHLTLGTVVSGSGAQFNGPTAGSLNPNNSADFTAPAAGFYAIGFTLSAQIAANSYLTIGACLQVRNT